MTKWHGSEWSVDQVKWQSYTLVKWNGKCWSSDISEFLIKWYDKYLIKWKGALNFALGIPLAEKGVTHFGAWLHHCCHSRQEKKSILQKLIFSCFFCSLNGLTTDGKKIKKIIKLVWAKKCEKSLKSGQTAMKEWKSYDLLIHFLIVGRLYTVLGLPKAQRIGNGSEIFERVKKWHYPGHGTVSPQTQLNSPRKRELFSNSLHQSGQLLLKNLHQLRQKILKFCSKFWNFEIWNFEILKFWIFFFFYAKPSNTFYMQNFREF